MTLGDWQRGFDGTREGSRQWGKQRCIWEQNLVRIIAKLTKHYNGNNDDQSPDLVDAEVADVLEGEPVDVGNHGHAGDLCLHLITIAMILWWLILWGSIPVDCGVMRQAGDHLSGLQLEENIGGGIELFNREAVGVPFACRAMLS